MTGATVTRKLSFENLKPFSLYVVPRIDNLGNRTDKLLSMLSIGSFQVKKRNHGLLILNTFAGFPITTEFGGTFFVTTAPAPTVAYSPIVNPGKIVALAPILAPFFTVIP